MIPKLRLLYTIAKWTTSWEKLFVMCEQQICRSVSASPQSVVLSAPFVVCCLDTLTCYIQNFKTHACFHSWAGLLEPCLVTNPQRQVFSWHGSSPNLSAVEINIGTPEIIDIIEPRQANLCLRAFRHDKFQLRMSSHSERPGIWLSVWRFLLTPCLYERAAKVLARLRACAGSPEPSLLA